MEKSQRFAAFLNYLLPGIGWVYVGIFHRKSSLALFHLGQSLGLMLFLVLITIAWGIVAWMIAWIPYAFVLSMALFVLPLTAYLVGVMLWITGMMKALLGRETPLPLIGTLIARLPS